MTSPPFEPEVRVPQLVDLSHLDHGPVPGIPDPYPSRRFEDYIEVRGFLVPKKRHTPFSVDLRDPNQEEVFNPIRNEWVPPERFLAGTASGEAEILNGIARILRLEVECYPVTSHTLERIPIGEISVTIAALCSLTSEKDRHYQVIEPQSPYETPEAFLRHVMEVNDLGREARDAEPTPILGEPEPVLIGPDGRKWYRVQLTSEPVRALRKLKRTKMNEAFFAGVRASYLKARAEGRSTTRAVAQWHERWTGRTPATSSVDRYVRLTKKYYGEEFFDAEDK